MISLMTLALSLVGAAVCFQVALGQSESYLELLDICKNAPVLAVGDKKCGACIRRHPKCAWCSKPDFDDDLDNYPCNIRENLEESCPPNMIVVAQSPQIETRKDTFRTVISTRHDDQKNLTYQLRFALASINATVDENDSRNVAELIVAEYVNITAISCNNQDQSLIFPINPDGLKENVTITFTKSCDCECTKPGNPSYIVKSLECNNRGDLACGQCKCPWPYIGSRCECDMTPFSAGRANITDLDWMCRPGNDSNAPICSGRGVCKCGACICDREDYLWDQGRFYGRYCECDKLSCPRANGKICGGHGTCKCDQICQCEEGWTGRDCSCPTSTETCMASNRKICNGQGVCVCGVCTCQRPYQGYACELCPTCPTPCVLFRDCVLYRAFDRRSMNQSEFKIKCQHSFIFVQDLPHLVDNTTLPDACQFVDPGDECTFMFKFVVSDSGHVTVFVQRDKSTEGTELRFMAFTFAFLVCPPMLPVLSIYLNRTED